MHRIVVVAFDGVVPFDLALPLEVFERVRLADGRPGYRVCVAGVQEEVDAGSFVLRAHKGLAALRRADTVVVPGVRALDVPLAPSLLRALRRAHVRGARILSICSGAFVLAAAGLLDGRRATTHWLGAPALAERHPQVEVDPDVLYVDGGDVLTSAGAAAGFDLCLHVVRKDHGARVAAEAARISVMPLERSGGQAQFIRPPNASPEGSLAALLAWMNRHLDRPHTLVSLSKRAKTSSRSLSRHFRDEVGVSPMAWLLHARVRRAQELLEETPLPVEQVAQRVGFGSATSLRQHFRAIVGTTPTGYRKAMGGRQRR